MTDVVLLVVLLAAGGCAWWLLRDLREVPAGADGPSRAASVAVVVPARDEEATVPALLGSLRRLVVNVSEVVVVDDGSHDATAAVARSGGARVVTADPPPAGWTGKAWACHLGARESSGDVLLFLDADTTLAPQALEGLLALVDRHGGLVSVQPYHDAVRPHEQLSSYFNVVSLLASGAFGRRPTSRPMAFGPCLLTSRTDYERAGGHAAVRGEILDDVRLAGAYQRAGLPVRCAVGGRSVRMRSYPEGLGQLTGGWVKNIASGASAAAPGPAAAAALWVGAHHAVAVGAALVLIEAATGWRALPSLGDPVLWAVAWAVLAWQLRSILHRIGSFSWWTWALFPAPLLVFDALFAYSAARTLVGRSVHWRGRVVDLGGPGSAGTGA